MGKKWLHVVLGTAVGLLLVWFLFRGTDWRSIWSSMRRASLGWILFSQVLMWITFFTRIKRWSYIVRAGEHASFRHMFSATQIGFLVNFTLPGRIGEVVRAVVLSRLTRISFSKSLAMVAMDRVTDIVGLIAVLLVSVCAYRPTEDLVIRLGSLGETRIPEGFIQDFALGTSGILVLIIGGFVALYINQRIVLRLSDRCIGLVSAKAARVVHGMLDQFAQGLHVFRSLGDLAKSIFFSLVTWGLFVLVYHVLMTAFGLSYPWYAPFVVTSAVAVALAAPIAPGFVGQFQAGIVVGVAICVPGFSETDVMAMAIATHVLTLIPVGMAGLFCLAWEDLRIREIFRSSPNDQTASPEN